MNITEAYFPNAFMFDCNDYFEFAEVQVGGTEWRGDLGCLPACFLYMPASLLTF